MNLEIEEGFKWVNEYLLMIEIIVIFSNGEVYFIYRIPYMNDNTSHKKFIGVSNIYEMKSYSANHIVYESNSEDIPERYREMLKAEYRREKIDKLLKNV